MAYISRRVAELDVQKKKLYAQITCQDAADGDNNGESDGYMEHRKELSVSDKITVVNCTIESIHKFKEKIEIRWKI